MKNMDSEKKTEQFPKFFNWLFHNYLFWIISVSWTFITFILNKELVDLFVISPKEVIIILGFNFITITLILGIPFLLYYLYKSLSHTKKVIEELKKS